jgi:hypothetical protein
MPSLDLVALNIALAGEIIRDRVAIRNEDQLHCLVANALRHLGVPFEQERTLGPGERVDFWLPDSREVIEVKKDVAGYPLLRQISRYLRFTEVTGAVAVAMRFSEIPPSLGGKPIRYLPLWPHMI